MDIYCDESIHDRGNFIVLAAVSATPEHIELAKEALISCGLTPGRDEFKSSMTMSGNENAQRLREAYRGIISQCKVGIAICALDERHFLMTLAARLAQKMAANMPGIGGRVYLDGGMKQQPVDLPPGFHLVAGCDSRSVIGVQLADCCAHAVATILLDEMGIAKRKKAASDSRDDDSVGDIALGWFLWASMRYALSSGIAVNSDDPFFEDPTRLPFGLELSDGCDPRVAKAANKRFGTVWIGCIS
ncbi:DUF3800 domain-containing protein [Rhizobium sp. 2MFCol3.1]|uniref:DUF3800 domain-containing protein n=1 Tax=Rhizobium sp. 2MFCol3.1 TaxID=1246459 RepID=UPI0003646A88|nr:DUF3800 domain-containing protein [Rhizobium sp. 2MFCol3.1]